MNRLKLYFMLLIVLATSIAYPSPKTNKLIPLKVLLKVATRQLIDNIDVYKGIHTFTLECAMDWCQLTQISLECEPISSSQSGFTPSITTSTTQAGFLEVSAMSEGMLEVTVFQATHRQLPAKIRFYYIPELQKFKTSTRVTGFKAEGFIDVKLFPQLEKTVDYIPIAGLPHAEALGCGVFVPGIETNKADLPISNPPKPGRLD